MLTKLNGDTFTLNAIYIEQVQSFPYTTVTLTSGKKFVVKEAECEVVQKAADLLSEYFPFSLSPTESEED